MIQLLEELKNRCGIEVVTANTLYNICRHGIENVTRDGDATQYADGLVEESHIIALHILPCSRLLPHG